MNLISAAFLRVLFSLENVLPARYEKPMSKYDVALSFAGEQRWYVDVVNSELKALGISTFYDDDSQVELLGKGFKRGLYGNLLGEREIGTHVHFERVCLKSVGTG